MAIFSKQAVQALAQTITRRSPALSRSINRRRFQANFGVTPATVSYVWDLLLKEGNLPRGFRPTHLLWTLVFLKMYACEHITSALCGCDEKTLRKWVWIGVAKLSELDLVSMIVPARRLGQPSVALLLLHKIHSHKLLALVILHSTDKVGEQVHT